jgi:hypothetical protein
MGHVLVYDGHAWRWALNQRASDKPAEVRALRCTVAAPYLFGAAESQPNLQKLL